MITYEKAKEAWSNELLSEQLQDLADDFLLDLSTTIELVGKEIASSEGKEPQRSLLIAEKIQLENFLKYLVELRCAKVVASTSFGREPGSLKPVERDLYTAMEGIIHTYKERFYRIPEEEEHRTSPSETSDQIVPEPSMDSGAMASPTISETVRQTPHIPVGKQNRILRILKEFPCFVGPDLRSYGPFVKEDVVALPDEVSEILLGRKVGEKIESAGEDI